MVTVITGENIQKFRLRLIFRALSSEVKGLKFKVSPSKAARQVLESNGIKPHRNKKNLLIQFENFINKQEQK